jgi:hypothetical protein
MVDRPNQQTESEIAPKAEKKPMGRPPTNVPTFPRDSLKESIAVADAIRKDGAGTSLAVPLLANSLGLSRRSKPFEYLLRSAERYGLTEGSVYSKDIVLKELGRAIVAPTDDSAVGPNLRAALLKPDLFAKFYNKYNGNSIPRPEVVKNVLEQQFGVRRTDVDECFDVLMKNIEEQGLKLAQKNDTLLWLDNLGKALVQVPASGPEMGKPDQGLERPPEVNPPTGGPEGATLLQGRQIPKQIFVAHGKNKKPLEQLERILNKFRTVNYKVAVEEPNRGLPVSAKVAELMKECTSGIFIFTADEETQDAKGNTVWRPSDNVVYELGAASVLYGRKIVIFKEEDVAFASDFGDIGYIPFEKDKLDAKTADLMLELINLGFMQLTPT